MVRLLRKSLKKAPVTAVERRQVIDIPPVKAVTTEHADAGEVRVRVRDEGAGPGRRARAGAVRPRVMGAGIYLWHGQFLSRDRACQGGCRPVRLRALARRPRRGRAEDRGLPRPGGAGHHAAPDQRGSRPLRRDRVPDRREARWVHSASAGKFALFTVHAKRGKDGMKAAGVLPSFAGIAVHDAWAPYDTFGNVAGHALCGAHVLRELVAVTETGTDLDGTWARQAIDALLALNEAAEAARTAARTPSTRKPARSTRTGTARPRRPGSPSTPPARASSRRNGTPLPRG